MLRCYSSTINH